MTASQLVIGTVASADNTRNQKVQKFQYFANTVGSHSKPHNDAGRHWKLDDNCDRKKERRFLQVSASQHSRSLVPIMAIMFKLSCKLDRAFTLQGGDNVVHSHGP